MRNIDLILILFVFFLFCGCSFLSEPPEILSVSINNEQIINDLDDFNSIEILFSDQMNKWDS